MRKLLLILLIPITAQAASLEALEALLKSKGVPVYQGHPMVSPELDRVLRDSYIRSGSIFGESGQRPRTGTPEYNDWIIDQAVRSNNLQWADYEAKKGRTYQWNK